MNVDVRSVLLFGAPIIAGLVVLHTASRKDSEDHRRMGLWRGMAFILAGVLLVVLPLAVWSGLFFGEPASRARHVSPATVLLLAGYLDAVFFWLIWNVNSYGYRPPGPGDNQWERNWGESYSPELKKRLFGPILAQLDREGKIGDLVVDIGSGARPVSGFLTATPGRKFIFIDRAGNNRRVSESQYLRCNAESVTRPESLSYQKTLVRVCRFLGRDPAMPAAPELATTLLFSDILNYVDFRTVIGGFSKFLKPDGRIIIANLPTRGIEEEFSANGLKRNEDLYCFLEEQNLEIEFKDFPCRPKGATEESEEMIVLVARKGG